MKKVWKFISRSSADPKATSLSIKFALLAIIPYLMQSLDMVCEFGYQCYDIDPNIFETIISTFFDSVFYILILISSIGTFLSLIRKFKRTITGKNLALMYSE